ncbi:hypothetical protein AALM99_05515 [Lactococcus muris]|uniref:Uncharacterized protein n=1 Tax=Lactococcus muris TaxID=2941330 RepID=A0ABV4DAC7_9LACT
MNREQKRKLGLLVSLSIGLLVAGTFAFTAFNQQAINDRENNLDAAINGRVHDYYNRETENKDVFAENFGRDDNANPGLVRIRLSEFMEIRRRGETDFTPLVLGTERGDVGTWTKWKPEVFDINNRQDSHASNAFDTYARLTFGWQREGELAPWYMPTFNHDREDLRTAAAGHARDWIQGNGATDATTNGTTHPGEGTDAYWTEDSGSYDNTDNQWPGSTVIQEVEQHLPQERPPMTIEQWDALTVRQKVGDYWVIDHNTGWAYWASLLEAGEATSYLLDAAEMDATALDQNISNGTYYYGIHVDSQFVSRNEVDLFLAADLEGTHDRRLESFLEGVKNNAFGDGNPLWNEDSPPSDFRFELMNPGRLFTMNNQRFRYLENMGGGNHLIIRNSMFPNTSWNGQPTVLQNWYTALIQAEPTLEAMVQPVTIPARDSVPGVPDASIIWTGAGTRWLPSNLASFPSVANDLTTVATSGGSKQAFALSLADVTKLSQPGGAFSNHAERVTGEQGGNNGWWLRTLGASNSVWQIPSTAFGRGGQLHGTGTATTTAAHIGVRPALILHQPAT